MERVQLFASKMPGVGALLLAMLTTAAVAPPAGAALRYTEVTVTEKDGAEGGTMVTRILLDGLRARIDFLGSEDEGAPVLATLVTSDGGKSVAFSEGGEDKCTQWDPAALFSTVGRLVAKARKLATVTVSGSGVEKILEEEGPSIHGHPTTHIRLRTTYAFKASAFLILTYTVKEEVVEDFWIATGLPDEPVAVELQKATGQTGFEEVDRLIGEAVALVPGVVLKQETVVDREGYKGKKSRTRESVEVTSLEQIDNSAISADAFSSPAGCAVVKDKEMEKLIIDFAKKEFR